MAKKNPSIMAGDVPPRQYIWDAIRQLNHAGAPITMASIQTEMGLECVRRVKQHRIVDYLRNLAAGGYIERTNVSKRPGERAEYTLLRDVGIEAPRVRRDGTCPPPPGREQMWRTLKIIGDFTGAELADAASTVHQPVAKTTADEYITMLVRADYLSVVTPASPGVPGRYRLVPSRWTGPMAPQIRRTKEMYDPNTGTVIYSRVIKTEGGEP